MTPVSILQGVASQAGEVEIYVAGGPVRDWLLERGVTDVDLVLRRDAIEIAKLVASRLGGTFVLLDERFQVARVVFKELCLDFSQFRGNATTIKEDLAYRDFTINAMALPLDEVLDDLEAVDRGLIYPVNKVSLHLIDPFDGWDDLKKGLIRALSEGNLCEDPLRMLRAFRFMATLGFSIEPKSLEWIENNASQIVGSAPERIDQELDKIMTSSRAGRAFSGLYSSGLLPAILPETREMEGVDQPGFHHLDVLGHLLEALSSMDQLVENPCIKFPNCNPFKDWLEGNRRKISWLKWAAFMHDFGKPSQKATRSDGRVTFYEHDKKGAEMAKEAGKRLRWSREKQRFVALLVRLHMRPFHLLNDLRKSGPSKRAMRRLLDSIGADYPALFLLAMADSMAGCGPMKPEGLDDEIALLFDKIHAFYLKSLRPVEENPPLLTGHDVMSILGIEPGPVVGQALQLVKEAQVEGVISTRQEAEELVRKHFESVVQKQN
ncbi:MAG: HD domain-containing protein [Thermodesulfobacteria bacterium]|nr:HD domain-containing protein [Thermodesulfobacteriota bacterium]